MKILQRLLNDERGFIISIELTLIATVAALGLMAGMSAMRDAVLSELSDVAGAVQDFNQSYTLFGVRGHRASTAGMAYLVRTDFCDSNDDASGVLMDNCVTIFAANNREENQGVFNPG